jgi:uncharacterized membrane protein YqiK
MQTFLKICSIVSIIIFSLRLAIMGNLTPGTVVFIIICGLLIMLGNRTVYIIAAAVAALVLFIKSFGGSPEGEGALLQSILTLAIVIFSLYIMIKGLFTSLGKRG